MTAAASTFLVLPDDDGIRPAGPPDACFYCGRGVGEPHRDSCVCIVRETTYGIFHLGSEIGRWTTGEPADWDIELCEFARNQAAWCKNNLLESPGLDARALASLPAIVKNMECCCDILDLRVVSRSDTPRRAAGG